MLLALSQFKYMSSYLLVLHLLMNIFSESQAEFTAYAETIPGTEVAMHLTPVTGGPFQMGSGEGVSEEDETPAHEVTVDDFWMGTYEVTWEQYDAFVFREDKNEVLTMEGLGIDGVSSATAPYVEMSKGMGKEGYPAIGMTQYAALTFCKWLSAKTGKFYRLPTEAEWEYACRASAETAYAFGDDAALLDTHGVYADNSDYVYAPVGSKKPNTFGLYDMSGNASEWTMDQYDESYYQRSEKANPWNRPETLYPRVVRGGSYKDTAEECRCTDRNHSTAAWKRVDPQIPKSRWWHTNAFFVGFRVVRPKNSPSPEEIKKYWLEPIDDYGK